MDPTKNQVPTPVPLHRQFVITLCDSAEEICPVWSGQPIIAHRPSPDPTATQGPDAATIAWQVTQQIRRRLERFASHPFEKFDALRLETATKETAQRGRPAINTQSVKP